MIRLVHLWALLGFGLLGGGAELPVMELPAPAEGDPSLPLVVLFSGDVGWVGGFDAGVARRLQQAGWPVVGVNSLKYFWSRRTPAETAADLRQLIDRYRALWHRERLVLVGYSQGADVLPFAFNRLPKAEQARVDLLVLLSPGLMAGFEVTLNTWLGSRPTPDELALSPELAQIHGVSLLVVTGTRDHDVIQDWPKSDSFLHLTHPGGHRLDNDSTGVAESILQRWQALPRRPASARPGG